MEYHQTPTHAIEDVSPISQNNIIIDSNAISHAIPITPQHNELPMATMGSIVRPSTSLQAWNWGVSLLGTEFGYLIDIGFSPPNSESYKHSVQLHPDTAMSIACGIENQKRKNPDTIIYGSKLTEVEQEEYAVDLNIAHGLMNILLSKHPDKEIDTYTEDIMDLELRNTRPKKFCKEHQIFIDQSE